MCQIHLRSMRKSLMEYRNNHPGKAVYDLSQSQARARTSLRSGSMPCLATSSTHVWLEGCGRCLSGVEKLKTLLYPTEACELKDFSPGVLTKMSGNGMFLPNVGWAILAHVLLVERR